MDQEKDLKKGYFTDVILGIPVLSLTKIKFYLSLPGFPDIHSKCTKVWENESGKMARDGIGVKSKILDLREVILHDIGMTSLLRFYT